MDTYHRWMEVVIYATLTGMLVDLMRDLVRYSTYQVVDNPVRLLSDVSDPRRREYLTRFADREGRMYLLRYWRKYNGKGPEERLDLFLSGLLVHRALVWRDERRDRDLRIGALLSGLALANHLLALSVVPRLAKWRGRADDGSEGVHGR